MKLESVLDLIASMQTPKKPLVVVFDEFQDVLKFKDGYEALAVMRSKIQFHSNLSYVFAGSLRNKMDEIFINSKHKGKVLKNRLCVCLEKSYFFSIP
ncbi:MAG: hypothetical protein U9N60_03040 [Thermodesulfobacteriota bacterium]|nr:hypothetical protein [Thermodesulfobacteriota bacterium]